jgi:hypothetical protein
VPKRKTGRRDAPAGYYASSADHCTIYHSVGLKMRLPLVIVAAAALILQPASAGTSDHRYKKEEHVELWVNKVRLK